MRTRARVAVAATAIVFSSLITTFAGGSASGADSAITVSPAAETSSIAVDDAQESVAIYRFWSPVHQAHFYTASAAERDAINAKWSNIWTYEGERYRAFQSQVTGSIPLHRFWSARLGGHFFTADTAEKDAVIKRWPDTWSYEGVAYYVYPTNTSVADTVPVARFWSSLNNHHFYTASATERDAVRARWADVWSYEGDNFRVPAAGVSAEPTPGVPNTGTAPANPGDTKNCNDFATYGEAKAWFDTYYPHYGDVARLDGNNDGIPCESLPGAPR